MADPRPMAMDEARAYWSGKVPMSKAEFDALAENARARAFTVSGLSRQDQMAEVHGALLEAVANGESLGDFKKRIRDVIEEKGWTGRRAWRVDNIYRTNVQSAFQAGRFAQLSRVASSRPYWRYVAVEDRRTRPTHLALHGKVYRHDHPFWNTWYPPNGFRCRCTVQSLSERQMKARGLQAETDMPDLVEPIDPVSGQRLPARPLLPDRGFGGNQARDWMAGLSPEEITGLRVARPGALCRRGEFADDPCRPPLAGLDRRHILQAGAEDILPASMSKADQVRAFLQEFGLDGLDDSKVFTVRGGFPLAVSKWLFTDKATGDFKATWGDKGPYMRLLARTIKNPFEVWWTPVEIGPQRRLVFALRLLRLFSLPGSKDVGGFCSFSLIGRTWEGATAFMPKAGRSEAAILDYLERQRAGVLIHRETLK